MDGQFDIVVAFLLIVYEIELLLDILIGDHSIQFLSQDLFSTDLKILLCDRIEDLDSALGIGKDQSFLEIFQENLMEVLIGSIHADRRVSLDPAL